MNLSIPYIISIWHFNCSLSLIWEIIFIVKAIFFNEQALSLKKPDSKIKIQYLSKNDGDVPPLLVLTPAEYGCL